MAATTYSSAMTVVRAWTFAGPSAGLLQHLAGRVIGVVELLLDLVEGLAGPRVALRRLVEARRLLRLHVLEIGSRILARIGLGDRDGRKNGQGHGGQDDTHRTILVQRV